MTGSESASATVMAVNSLRSFAFMPKCSTAAMIKRYVIAPSASEISRLKKPPFPKSTSPMMSEARPITMEPVPIWISAKDWLCAISAPETATSPLESTRPKIFITFVLMPCARAMFGFPPVARMAQPTSVPKNQ